MMGRVIVMQEDAGFRGRNWPEYNESLVKRDRIYITIFIFWCARQDKDLELTEE
jgi:hypothetical protein